MRLSRVLPIIWLGIIFYFGGLLLPTFAIAVDQAPALRVIRITPTGQDVPPGRQLVFQFDRAVVPLGRMERKASEIPVVISPAINCQWRWLNTSALACQLDEKSSLSPATRYRVTLNPGLKASDGAILAAPVRHSFTTERPKVRHAWFKNWTAPGLPLIRMTFNQPVARESVAKHVFMVADGPQKQRTSLKVEPDPADRQTPLYLPLPGEKIALIPDAATSSRPADADQKKMKPARQPKHGVSGWYRRWPNCPWTVKSN